MSKILVQVDLKIIHYLEFTSKHVDEVLSNTNAGFLSPCAPMPENIKWLLLKDAIFFFLNEAQNTSLYANY